MHGYPLQDSINVEPYNESFMHWLIYLQWLACLCFVEFFFLTPLSYTLNKLVCRVLTQAFIVEYLGYHLY